MKDRDTTANVRPATPAERADPRAMHAANRAAWDEAAERYEGWFDEAVELIRGGGSNLFGVEHELIGDLRAGRGTDRAIHLQCAGVISKTVGVIELGRMEINKPDYLCIG